MGHAWIDGKPATLDAAVAEAARLLRAARLPVIAGLGTDVAGARAAVALAQQLGGVIDHMHSDALLRDLAVLREAGTIMTTANEARLRADMVLAIGSALQARPEFESLLAPPAAPEIGRDVKRRVFRLCPPRGRSPAADQSHALGRDIDEVPALVAQLRARVAGRPVTAAAALTRKLDALAADLQAARFGVVVWWAAELDALTIEMLCGLVNDLNVGTRFAGVAVMPPDHAAGVAQVCGWMTGFPVRVGFGHGRPDHDPWRHDAERLIASSEADCVLWISAYGLPLSKRFSEVATVALTSQDAGAPGARVVIPVGRPGLDHDSVEQVAMTERLAAIAAAAPSDAMSVAQAIARIAACLLEAPGAPAC